LGEGMSSLLSYDEVLRRCSRPQPAKHDSHPALLLGNGFSISLSSDYSYGHLLDTALTGGCLTPAHRVLFDKFGTVNFERILRALSDAQWINRHFGIGTGDDQQLSVAGNEIRNALIKAIVLAHAASPSAVLPDQLRTCQQFLAQYGAVFTLNYDLLPYWVTMNDDPDSKLQDGFSRNSEDGDLVFTGRFWKNRRIYHLHGGLHFYRRDGRLYKQNWTDNPKSLVHAAQEAIGRGEYPLFVAEGEGASKLQMIGEDGYLSYCRLMLMQARTSLVTFGFAFGTNDQHVVESIAQNPDIRHVYIGVFGERELHTIQSNLAKTRYYEMRENLKKLLRKGKTKESAEEWTSFYDSSTVDPWATKQATDPPKTVMAV
jgi:hypothetical protein